MIIEKGFQNRTGRFHEIPENVKFIFLKIKFVKTINVANYYVLAFDKAKIVTTYCCRSISF